MLKRDRIRHYAIAWVLIFGWDLAPIAGAETHKDRDLQPGAGTPVVECGSELVSRTFGQKMHAVRELLSAFATFSSSPILWTSSNAPSDGSKIASLYNSMVWEGNRAPWPGFKAFFEHESPSTANELSLLPRASRIQTLSAFDALRLPSGIAENVDFYGLSFSPDDPFRLLNTDNFITRQLSEADLALWNQSLILQENVLVDVREVLEARIYYRPPINGSPIRVCTPLRQQGGKTDIMALPDFSLQGVTSWLWGVVEYLIGNDQQARMATEIVRRREELRRAGNEILLIEFPHSHPFDSYLLTIPEDFGNDRKRVVYPMFSVADKTFLSNMVDLLGRGTPIAMSVVSGLSRERLSKEYAIIYE